MRRESGTNEIIMATEEMTMPYISKKARTEIDKCFNFGLALGPGELNYVITRLLMGQQPGSYAEFNALIGVLECCKLELYRRACVAYEELKINENGDIPEYEKFCGKSKRKTK